jgi:hypothetical protein
LEAILPNSKALMENSEVKAIVSEVYKTLRFILHFLKNENRVLYKEMIDSNIDLSWICNAHVNTLTEEDIRAGGIRHHRRPGAGLGGHRGLARPDAAIPRQAHAAVHHR